MYDRSSLTRIPKESQLVNGMVDLCAAGRLPPALFIIETLDATADDLVLPAFNWQLAGSRAVIELSPGAVYAVTWFPSEKLHLSAEYHEVLLRFMGE
jgi:hypothetical protein